MIVVAAGSVGAVGLVHGVGGVVDVAVLTVMNDCKCAAIEFGEGAFEYILHAMYIGGFINTDHMAHVASDDVEIVRDEKDGDGFIERLKEIVEFVLGVWVHIRGGFIHHE